jgi:RHS repeat-associated protein
LSAIDVACPTSQSVFAIASPHELHGSSSPSSSTGTRSFCCNHQYSITAITTSAGAISERYAYTAYGQPTVLNASASVLSSSAISNRYTYTGREWDATLGLHHFRARWMSPSAGRFLGRDPIGYEDGWLLYKAGMFLVGIDFSGNKLTVLPSAANSKETCSDGGNKTFYLNTAGVPCDGVIIAFVSATCKKQNCPECSDDIQNETVSGFQGAIRVQKDHDPNISQKVAMFTQGAIGNLNGTCGSYSLKMEFRLFCDGNYPDYTKWSDTPSSKCYEPKDKWKNTGAINIWWKNKYNTQFGSPTLSVNASWACCPCNTFFKISGNPETGKEINK